MNATPGITVLLSFIVGRLLDGESAKCLKQVAVDRLVLLDSLGERYIDDFVVGHTNHDVALVFEQGVDGSRTHAGREDTVVGCR